MLLLLLMFQNVTVIVTAQSALRLALLFLVSASVDDALLAVTARSVK